MSIPSALSTADRMGIGRHAVKDPSGAAMDGKLLRLTKGKGGGAQALQQGSGTSHLEKTLIVS